MHFLKSGCRCPWVQIVPTQLQTRYLCSPLRWPAQLFLPSSATAWQRTWVLLLWQEEGEWRSQRVQDWTFHELVGCLGFTPHRRMRTTVVMTS